MKKIEAFIRHEAFEPIRAELLDKGFPSLSIIEAKGSGRQKGIVERYRGSTLTVNVRPKLKLEIVVEDKDKAVVVETILKHARTGEVGDGKIFVLPVEEAIRIRTGEDGERSSSSTRSRRSRPSSRRRADFRTGRLSPRRRLRRRLASLSMADERISLSEAARRSGVPASTLKRWAEEKIVPVRRGRWTATAAAQARVVARMRERGYSLEDLKRPGARGGSPSASPRSSSPSDEGEVSVADVAARDRARAGADRADPGHPRHPERAASATSAPRTRRRCATAPGCSPPASRWSPSCSWSASTCSRCGGSPTPRSASSTSTCTNR